MYMMLLHVSCLYRHVKNAAFRVMRVVFQDWHLLPVHRKNPIVKPCTGDALSLKHCNFRGVHSWHSTGGFFEWGEINWRTQGIGIGIKEGPCSIWAFFVNEGFLEGSLKIIR